MRPLLRNAVAAVLLSGLWAFAPLMARAQTDSPQAPDTTPVVPSTSGATMLSPGQIIVPGANPAQTVPGYATVQPSPAQPYSTGTGSMFNTTQPSTGTVPNYMNQPTYNPTNGQQPLLNTTPPINPNYQQPANAMQSTYVARPSYTTVVPLGNVGRPSYVTAQPLSSISPAGQYVGQPSYVSARNEGTVAHPSSYTAQPLSSISPAGQYVGQPTWSVGRPAYSVGQPSSASVSMRGNLGQLPQSNMQNGAVFVVPGTFPQGYTGPYTPGLLHR